VCRSLPVNKKYTLCEWVKFRAVSKVIGRLHTTALQMIHCLNQISYEGSATSENEHGSFYSGEKQQQQD